MKVTHSAGKSGGLYLGIQNYLAGPEQGNIRPVLALWSNTELPETSHCSHFSKQPLARADVFTNNHTL